MDLIQGQRSLCISVLDFDQTSPQNIEGALVVDFFLWSSS